MAVIVYCSFFFSLVTFYDNIRDVFLQSKCDDGVRELAKLLGWEVCIWSIKLAWNKLRKLLIVSSSGWAAEVIQWWTCSARHRDEGRSVCRQYWQQCREERLSNEWYWYWKGSKEEVNKFFFTMVQILVFIVFFLILLYYFYNGSS